MMQRAKIERWALIGLGFFAAAIGVVVSLSSALDSAEITPGVIQAYFVATSLETRDEMAAERHEVATQILMLGDSMLMPGKEMKRNAAIPAMLGRAMRGDGEGQNQLKVYPIAFPGATYTSFYYLSEELIAANPDVVVLEFNLAWLSPHWVHHWARPDHAAWLGWRRLPEALGFPLYHLGLTADRILWTVTCLELGCGNTWNFVQREQSRISGLLDLVRDELAFRTGMRAIDELRGQRMQARAAERRDDPTPDRRTAAEYLNLFEASFDGVANDDIALKMLAATVRDFRVAGIHTVIYVNPINVEGMKRRGVWNPSGIELTSARIEAAVVEAGGTFVDLHGLLPDSRFRDRAEHLTYRGHLHGQGLLVARLAPVVLESLRPNARAAD